MWWRIESTSDQPSSPLSLSLSKPQTDVASKYGTRQPLHLARCQLDAVWEGAGGGGVGVEEGESGGSGGGGREEGRSRELCRAFAVRVSATTKR